VAIRAAADTITPDARAGDFAQAAMDLGSAICTPRAPKCLLCPLRPSCAAFAQGTPEAFPVKAKKRAKPQRYGTIFWLMRGDDVLLVRRPDKGLLGGMRALPTGDWADAPPGLDQAPAQADWHVFAPTISHGFTHFDLELALAVARVEAHLPGDWWPVATLGSAGLPTVFAKAAAAIRKEMAR
jgi:A/G-specific adenine glycosylase